MLWTYQVHLVLVRIASYCTMVDAVKFILSLQHYMASTDCFLSSSVRLKIKINHLTTVSVMVLWECSLVITEGASFKPHTSGPYYFVEQLCIVEVSILLVLICCYMFRLFIIIIFFIKTKWYDCILGASCLFCFLLTYVAVLDRLAGPCHFHFDYLCNEIYCLCDYAYLCTFYTQNC